MLKTIFKNTLSDLKKNGLMSTMLCIMLILSCCVVGALLLVPGLDFLLLFVLIPLILVPVVFSIQTMHFGLRENSQPNGTLFFRFYKLYFAPGFMGTYRLMNSILFAMLAELAVSGLVGGLTLALSQSPAYVNAIEELGNLLEAGMLDQAQNYLFTTTELKNLMYISYIPGFGVGILVAFLSASFNSMSLYFKIKNPMINPGLSSRIYTMTKNTMRGEIIKEYWGTNWPIFVLMTAGYAGGALIAYYNNLPFNFGQVIGLGLALAGALIYSPFFFNNIENIYLVHHETFVHGPEKFAERMQEALSSEMSSIQKQMEDLAKQKEDLENQRGSSNVDENGNNIVDAEVKDDEDE